MLNVSAAGITDIANLITVEKASPCNALGTVFNFSQASYLEDLSSPPDNLSFDEQGNIIYSFDESVESSTMYFKVSSEYDALFKFIDTCRSANEVFIDESTSYPTLERVRLYTTTDIHSENLSGSTNVYLNIKFIYEDDTVSKINSQLQQSTDGYKQEIDIFSAYFGFNSEKTVKYVCLEINNSDNENLAKSSGFISALKCHFSIAEHETTVVGKEEGTCIKHGLTGREYCEVCDTYLTQGTVVAPNANNHVNTTVQEAKEPTCTEDGCTEGLYCLDCKKTVKKSSVIKALGHKMKTVSTKKATYVANGKKTLKCEYCGETKIKSISKLKLKTPKFTLKGAKGKFTVKYTSVKDATGFEIKYKIKNGKFKTVKVTTKKSMSKVISKLKKGKYSVQIRAFVKQSGKTANSNWTNLKSVTVK